MLLCALLFVSTAFAQSEWRDLLTPGGRVVDLSGRGMFEIPAFHLQPDVQVLVLDDNDLTALPPDLAQRCPYSKAGG